MKIKIKDLISFKDFSERKKRNYILKLRFPTVESEKKEKGGGDYWVRSISAIIASCKESSNEKIVQKIFEIENDKNNTTHKGTLQKYDRNLEILNTFKEFDFIDLFPDSYEILEKTLKKGEIVLNNNFEIKIQISLPFTFYVEEVRKVGTIWFVAIKDGYSRSQLGIFAELAYNFLNTNYSALYEISPENILIVDASSTRSVNYSMVKSGQLPSQLSATLKEISSSLR